MYLLFLFADGGEVEVYDSAGAPEDTIQQEAIDICSVSCIH